MPRQRRLTLLAATGLLSSLTAMGPCLADPFQGAAPVAASTLESERGGFFSVAGVEFGFAATLETMVDGQVALTTTLTLQNDGSLTQHTDVNPGLQTALNAGSSGGTTVTQVSGGQQLSNATGLDLSGVNGSGVVIKNDSGVTAVLNNIGSNQFQNVVINTASGQTINQNTAITLTLPATNLAQDSVRQVMSGVGNSLQSALGAGIH